MNLDPQKKFIKANKAKLGCSFDKELLIQFKEACSTLGIDQTPLIIDLMINTIDRANSQKKDTSKVAKND